MDVERTIEFILKTQARAERRVDKIDVRLNGIAKLLQQGMRMLVKTDTTLAELAQAQKRTDAKVAQLAQAQKGTDAKVAGLTRHLTELAQAQKATERSLKAFIDSLRNGRNGRNRG